MTLSFSSLRSGSAQRGEETRRRILDAAIETFASVGYEGAHTRQLAELAGVKLPAIPYYFGSKEGLFRAVIERIAAELDGHLAATGDRVRQRLAEGTPPREALVDLLCALLDAFIETMLSHSFPDSWRLIIARAELENLPALEPVFDNIRRHTVEPAKLLIERLLGEGEGEDRAWLHAAALLGEIMIFTKPQVRCGFGWTEFSDERTRSIKAIVLDHARATFARPRSPVS